MSIVDRIPIRYHSGMSKQIAVRLPDDLVDFMDTLVAQGEEVSRATIVLRALKRERRRLGALHDIEILKRTEPDEDMNAMVAYLAHRPIGLE
jgi:Arc/MetJ-type ribon-helix-helix transcriptional regulator